jgi:uncharacterized protein YcfJ
MKKKIIGTMLCLTSLLSKEVYMEIEAPVIKSKKIIKKIVKRTPYIDCQYVENKKNEGVNIPGMLIGGIVGTQLGGGTGTILTTVLGVKVGSELEKKTKKNQENLIKKECVTRYRQQIKTIIVGYKNHFVFEGKKLTKVTEQKENKIKIKVVLNF